MKYKIIPEKGDVCANQEVYVRPSGSELVRYSKRAEPL